LTKIITLIIKLGPREGKEEAKWRPKAEACPQHSSYTSGTHKASAATYYKLLTSIPDTTATEIYTRHTVRSKVWVCGLSLAGIAGSNPARGMDVCFLWVLYVVR
jgi:hypothetical protein